MNTFAPQPWTAEEARSVDEFRAMSIGVDTAGGFGIPILIDPTILITNREKEELARGSVGSDGLPRIVVADADLAVRQGYPDAAAAAQGLGHVLLNAFSQRIVFA